MKGQRIELVTRRISAEGQPETEIVTAVVVGDDETGQRLDVPRGSKIRVEYDAGDSIAIVRLELFAHTVRYVGEDEL